MLQMNIEYSALENFLNDLQNAKESWKKDLELFLEGVGMEFLKIVQNEIITKKVVDTRLLLNSFQKGGANNIFENKAENLTITVGTNVKYASYVNDGHWTNPKGTEYRWIPGVWSGDIFTYMPGAKTGMMLKQQWVEGRHYWESAIQIMEQMLPGMMEKLVDKWMSKEFGI